MTANRLARETSPYLLQHKDNPVDWRAWNDAALAEATETGRPILLSVGYAACHWCHVMAHESFEDATTAAFINTHFLPIKVDREERPDLDLVYQTALAFLGVQGGWPLTMFLAPSGQPYWGGTYFPPTARYGRPSFMDVLKAAAGVWETAPDKVAGNVKTLTAALDRGFATRPGGLPDEFALGGAASVILPAIDMVAGGLSGAPKFPQVPIFALLWRRALATGDQDCRRAVTVTLDAICQGGIYDHLAGGFARYSTDADWLAPHFEKMLYDNAQLVELLTLVWQDTRSDLYARRVAETIGWLEREMATPEGAFAAALDADSEGEEGRFYTWSAEDIAELLPDTLYGPFEQAYDVTPEGNWNGMTILHRTEADVPEDKLAQARSRLLAARNRRPRPARDDKLLADWNGMTIAALANAAFAFDRRDWLAIAERAFTAICRLHGEDGRLAHGWRAGRRQARGLLDDHAQMARAALILHEITGDEGYLAHATAWVATLNAHYWDAADGGYYMAADDGDDLPVRPKTALDHATPSGNGVMVEVLARLHYLTGSDEARRRAESLASAFAGDTAHAPPGLATLLNAWDYLANAVQITVSGPRSDPGRKALLRAVATVSLPNRLLFPPTSDASTPTAPAHVAAPAAGGVAARVCFGQVCTPPLADPEALRDALTSR